MREKTALLLVDTQEDFLARNGLTPDRATLVANITALLAHARQRGWPVIHVHSRVASDRSDAMPHRRSAPEAVTGSPGAMPPAELAPHDGEPLLFKRFFSAFDCPDLESTLSDYGVHRLIVAGAHSHACIRDTANDAYARGFEVVLPDGAIGSYDPAHAAAALAWQDGRAAAMVPLTNFVPHPPEITWIHRDPCDQRKELHSVRLTPAEEVAQTAEVLGGRAPLPIEERRERLLRWRDRLAQLRGKIRAALSQDVAKPIRDADGEIDYGLALLSDVASRLSDEEAYDGHCVGYRQLGLVGLITPWNNPFAIPIGKIAPALGYGNAVVWKPALAGSNVADLIAASLRDCDLDQWIAVTTGDSGTGDAIVRDSHVKAIAFTGSAAVGRAIVARAGVRQCPVAVQAELGGSNAAIVDASADLDAAAADLAPAMFSFSGQRCTAIRRIILVGPDLDVFVDRLVAEIDALKLGFPVDPATQLGPMISAGARERLLNGIAAACAKGGRVLCGGKAPSDLPPEGCWLEPTLVEGVSVDHPLNQQEWFGPVASLLRARDFDEALALHNHTSYGLLGALYSADERNIAAFAARAEAGLLSINRARPPFSAAGPFNGWKDSGYGIPEHGRWNRDFYTRAQASYRT